MAKVRIVVVLPLPTTVAANMMLAVGTQFPGAVIAEPTEQETAKHGEVMVMEVEG